MFVVPVSRVSRQFGQDNGQGKAHYPHHLSCLLDDSFDRFFGAASTATTPAADKETARSPALDVAETETAYTVTLEVPGVNKEEVKVSVDGRQVTVQASTPRTEEKKEGAAAERVVYRERATPRYARTLTLPAEVDQAEAGAKLENGVLTLTLPKRSARSAAQISVN